MIVGREQVAWQGRVAQFDAQLFVHAEDMRPQMKGKHVFLLFFQHFSWFLESKIDLQAIASCDVFVK